MILAWVWFLGLSAALLEMVDQRRLMITTVFILGLLCFFAAAITAGFDERYPRQNSLSYRMDANKGQSWWLSDDDRLDAFTSQYFLDVQAKRKHPDLLGENFPPVWLSPSPMMNVNRPFVDVLEHIRSETTRKMVLRIKSNQTASIMRLTVTGGVVLSAKIDGQIYSPLPRKSWKVFCVGWEDKPVLIELALGSGQSDVLLLYEMMGKLPEFAMPRSSDTMQKPSALSATLNGGSTIVYRLLITNSLESNSM